MHCTYPSSSLPSLPLLPLLSSPPSFTESYYPSPASPTRPLRTAYRLVLIPSISLLAAHSINPILLVQALVQAVVQIMFNFIYARASRFTIVRDNTATAPSRDSAHLQPAQPLVPAQSINPAQALCMARIPVDLYRPILELFASNSSTSRAELITLLTVSKALSREVQRLLYNSLVLTADKPKPTFTDATYPLVRKLKIVVGNRSREAEHIRHCAAILPRLVRLESLEIRGRGWNMDALEKCLPRPGSEHGIMSLTSLALDASLTVPVARFIAAQPQLQELDLVGGMATTVLPDALTALPPTLPALTKLKTSNTICAHLLPLAPALKHVKLAFDLSETLQDVLSTLASLPLSTVSVFFNTTRKDLTPALAALPRTLKNLSMVLVPDQQDALLEHLGALGALERLVLNVHQAPVSLTNPWSPLPSLSASSTPSTSPSMSPMALPVSLPDPPPRSPPFSFGVDSPIVREESPLELQADSDEEVRQEEEANPLVVALKACRPTLLAIHLDEHTYARRRCSWVSTAASASASESTTSTEWKRVQSVDTAEFKTSSRPNELDLWESL